ncbi:MAG: 5-(carboxyamino)imidazole ribonucleotide mutase [Lachnospirales bacterium]
MVSIVMGSISDKETMLYAKEILDHFNIKNEIKIVSAHRTPHYMYEFAKCAKENNTKVIIAGAGGAAHLPGMIASLTNIPVIGVPIKSSVLNGVDSLLSIVQMPGGVPVGTMSIGKSGAKNAGLFATRILAIEDDEIFKKLDDYTKKIAEDVLNTNLGD